MKQGYSVLSMLNSYILHTSHVFDVMGVIGLTSRVCQKCLRGLSWGSETAAAAKKATQ